MKKKSDKITFKETFQAHSRAFGIWYEYNPKMFFIISGQVLVRAIAPYLNIFFSAQLLNELTGNKRAEMVWKWVLIALLANGVSMILQAVLTRWREAAASYQILWRQHYEILRKKMQQMDFAVMEKQEVRDLYSTICQNANWSCWGLPKIPFYFERGLEAVIRIAAAVLLSVELFIKTVPASAGAWTILNHPLTVILMVLLLLAITLVGSQFTNKANSYWARVGEAATLGNRIFGYFGFAIRDRSRAMDMRMYAQPEICSHYLVMNDSFNTDSEIAGYARGAMGIYSAIGAAVSRIFTGVVYVFVCVKAWAGAFGIGSVTQYISSITSLSAGCEALLSTYGQMRSNTVYLRSVFAYLDAPNEMYQGSLTTEKRNDRDYEVEFQNVSFKYPGSDTYALRNVNMKFKVGQRLAVVGENGSGKTTFIKLLCRLYDPTEGQILLNGIDIRKYRYDDYMSIFSTVFQDFQLLGFPLGENVAIAHDYDREKVKECLIKAGFGDRLASMPNGLDTYLYRDFENTGVQVSGGEAQKIALARALYKDAAFIILDEPTAALDPVAEYEVYTRFNDIVEDKTTIFISHRLASCRFCDDIAVFDQGSVIQQGNHESLLADENGKYYALWHAQAQYYQEA